MNIALLHKAVAFASTVAFITIPGPSFSQSASGASPNPPASSSSSGSQGTSGASSPPSAQAGAASTSGGGAAKTDQGASSTKESSMGETQKNKAAAAGKGALPPGHPKISYMVVPVVSTEGQNMMKKGCWAKFYDNTNFSGDTLTLVGPAEMPDMTGPFGLDWERKISSVETGPKARVLVYDNENFNDLVSTFKPGQKSNDVSKKMGFFDEFKSVKIACDNVAS